MREAGEVTLIDPGADRPLFHEGTRMCCHCGKHWVPALRPQDRKLRTWCMKCNGPVCGVHCQECVPMEKMLEIMEGTVDPTSVSVGGGYEGSLWLPASYS